MTEPRPLIDPNDSCQDFRCTRIDGQCVGSHCGRCGSASSYQGHYFSVCSVTGQLGEFHFCCPDDCALQDAS